MSNPWSKNKALIIGEMLIYGAILVWFLEWFLPIGFGQVH